MFKKSQEKIEILTQDTFLPTDLNLLKETFKELGELEELNLDILIENKLKDENPQSLLKALLSKEIFIQVLESIQDGIQVTDCQGKICYINPAFLKITGLIENDRIGRNIFEVSADGSIASVLKTGSPVYNLKNSPMGTSVELLSTASPITVLGKIVGVVAIIKDVQEVITLTEQLKKSNVLVKELSEKIVSLAKASYTFDSFIGDSVVIQNVLDMARTATQNDSTVLIQGETGTGKEIIANAIHNASKRATKPFISVNCSAIPEHLLESEFFGHEKGSFTGAIKLKIGKFELAQGGTLFLDEIGDMNLGLQAKILRVIQEKEIERIGAANRIKIDARIIAATNRDLRKMILDGSFRQDLYYRLNIWNIIIPPLRERKADIEGLSDFLIQKLCRKLGRKKVKLNTKALGIMIRYNWPGNVRELENVLERAILGSKGKTSIDESDLKFIFEDTIIANDN